MKKINENFESLKKDYLFNTIEKRIKSSKNLINLGIGDATFPIPKKVAEAISKEAFSLTDSKTFRGYGNSQGEKKLREEILKRDYKNLDIKEDEIFISSGTKRDIAAFQELFSRDIKVGIPDPSYPVYRDSNILFGRKNIIHLNCLENTNFLPFPPSCSMDLIYLCSPHNPTGTAFSKNELKAWVDYAEENNSIILYDGAYFAFIKDKNLPKSIYEIDGAKRVAVEFRSFSKTASFSGIRLSYIVVPKEIPNIYPMWKRFIDTKFGNVSYPIQAGGMAIYSKEGQNNIKEMIANYQENAKILKDGLELLDFSLYGGENSPYIWCRTKDDLSSFEYFEKLIREKEIITVPGNGFGKSGEGFIRFSSFAKREDIKEAILRLKKSSP